MGETVQVVVAGGRVSIRHTGSEVASHTETVDQRQRVIEPKLVAEVEFTAWTRDGHIRHPSFKNLREDKPAREVTIERSTR